MNIFINDVPVYVLKPDEQPETGSYTHEMNAQHEPLSKAKFFHHLMIWNMPLAEMDMLFELIDSKVPTPLFSVQLTIDDYDGLKAYLHNKFKVVEAAGGLIRKKDKFLMIYRLKKWDLPKGKKENNETYKETAVREVGEECNVAVNIGKKICTTWHTYTMNKRAMIKKTKWYEMDCKDDSRMKPMLEEDIEELKWMTRKEVYHALENSYRSIRFVVEKYYKKNGE